MRCACCSRRAPAIMGRALAIAYRTIAMHLINEAGVSRKPAQQARTAVSHHQTPGRLLRRILRWGLDWR